MGVELIIAGVMLAATVAIMLIPMKGKGSGTNPASLDSFQITQIQEGAVVPMVWGRCRLTTTLMWYGNLVSKDAKAPSSGGKGFGGGGGASIGYDYWLDMWHLLCIGPGVTLTSLYIQDKEVPLGNLGTYAFNDGSGLSFPTQPGIYASPMLGIAHVFMDGYFLGTNVTNVPTFHFIVTRTSSAPLTYANMSNGCNPAAIIYDLLIAAGVYSGDIDLVSFQAAATHWNILGYGLNLAISRQAELRELINQVFQYVDGALRIDENNRFLLKAYSSADTYVVEIPTEDFKAFQFKRRTYDDVSSDFRAKFTDEDQDFTERSLRTINPAVAALQSRREQKTFDLTAFRDVTTASKRLWELMKRWSYPEAQITTTVGIKYAALVVGDIVRINHSDYDIADADYRVTEIGYNEIDSNEIKLELVQMTESLFDAHYSAAGGSDWVRTSYIPAALSYQRVFELPYTAQYGSNPAYLLLAARAGNENAYDVTVSCTGSDYLSSVVCSTFSQRGVLAQAYGATGITIDDTTGIIFTPSREDPIFDTISRTALFSTLRFAIIDDEIIAFESMEPYGGSSYQLLGCIRGVLNTAIASHSNGAQIWLTSIADNVLENVTAGTFYVKMLPIFGPEILDAGSATPITVTSTAKASIPWGAAKIQVVRVGSTNTVTMWPTTKIAQGAGVRPGAAQIDSSPPAIEGTFEYYTSLLATVYSSSSETWVITTASAFTLYVRSVCNGSAGAYESVVVSAGDATYVGPAA